MADQHEQHRDDDRRVQCAGQVGGLAGAALPVGGRGIGREIDIDAAEALAEGAVLPDGGEQEGVHRDVQEVAEFLVGEAVLGFAEPALDGGGQGAVAGEVDVADGEQAEAVEAIGVAVGVEAAVVVVAAEVADLAEVAEGGGPGGLAEGMLELFESDG